MMNPLTRGQKIVAYTSLVMVVLCTVFGLFTMWLYMTEF